MKTYVLDIQNIGEDVYTLMSKGHHDIHEFMRVARADYPSWNLGVPEHIWMRTVPTRNPGYKCLYTQAAEGQRGAWPATYVSEAYNEELYESVFPDTSERECPHCLGKTTAHKRHCDYCGEPS